MKPRLARIKRYLALLLSCSALIAVYWSVDVSDKGVGDVTEELRDLTASRPMYNKAHHERNDSEVSMERERQAEVSRYRFRMRSDSNETTFDKRYSSGISDQCTERDYGNLTGWPTASVIITFCDNEILSDILHTLHSIIQRTPSSLLKEIILIADNTKKDDLGQTLDNYCNAVFGEVVHIHRTAVTMGIIRNRLLGARMASGDVVVVLDAHMEVQEKWLEAIVFEINRDKKILAGITLDWMSPNEEDSWRYQYGSGNIVCYFDWDLTFGHSWTSPAWSVVYDNDNTTPIPIPCSIGNWAMHKSFFIEIGELDQGMQMWGGENIDIAIRTWLFGGRCLQISCSHVAHQERPGQRDYRNTWYKYKLRNYKRMVEVWFDEYKKYFYQIYPELLGVDPGDLSERFELKKKSKHNFSWYLRNVYPQLGVYDINTLAYGKLHSLSNFGCMRCDEPNTPVRVGSCTDEYNRHKILFFSNQGNLRRGAFMVVAKHLKKDAELFCGEALYNLGKKSLPVLTHWKDGPIVLIRWKLCLEHNTETGMVMLKACDRCKINQRWRWQRYTPLYKAMSSMMNNSDNMHSNWNRLIAEKQKILKDSWPSPKVGGDSKSELTLC